MGTLLPDQPSDADQCTRPCNTTHAKIWQFIISICCFVLAECFCWYFSSWWVEVEPADLPLQWNILLTCKLSRAIIYLGLIYPSYACKNLTICKNADVEFLHSLALCSSIVLGCSKQNVWCKIKSVCCVLLIRSHTHFCNIYTDFITLACFSIASYYIIYISQKLVLWNSDFMIGYFQKENLNR